MAKKSPTGCRSEQLFGLWLIDPAMLESYRSQAMEFELEALAKSNAEAEASQQDEPPLYENVDGVAVIEISGPTTKYPTSYQRYLGGTSTLMVEKALSKASADPTVNSIMLHMDNAPGGTVAGAYELVDRIKSVGLNKPIDAYGSDLMTSAAYLFASACRSITANKTAVVGSIGTRSHLIDSSAKLAKDGIKVIPIAAGKYKAAGLPGTPITEEQVKDFERQINAMNDLFIEQVSEGRGLSSDVIRKMEARCYVGKEAVANKLIDGIGSFDQAMQTAIKQNNSIGGGNPGTIKPAAPLHERNSSMELLTQIREIFGAADMTEDQAAAAVKKAKADTTSLQTSLSTAKAENEKLVTENAKLTGEKPKVQDPEILRDRAEIAVGKLDIAVGKQEMPPVIANKLKAAVIKDGKPNAFLLTSAAEIDGRPIDFITSLFAGEKLGGPATGSQTGLQELSRSVPGESEVEKKQMEEGDRLGKMHLDKALAQKELSKSH